MKIGSYMWLGTRKAFEFGLFTKKTFHYKPSRVLRGRHAINTYMVKENTCF